MDYYLLFHQIQENILAKKGIEIMEENKIETRTLEELLKYLREKNNWSYYDVIEKLNEKSVIIDEKQLKKWEIGL